MKIFRGLLAGLALLFGIDAVRAEGILPIFDTHVHYSKDAWDTYPPAVIFEKLKTEGIDAPAPVRRIIKED